MALLPKKGKQKGRKENKPMASSGKGRPRDALGPRQSAAPFKKQGRKENKPMASSGKGRPRDALGPRQSAAPFNKQGRKGSKRHEEASSRPSSSSSLVLAQDDEPDFPRGGRSLLTREEEAEARAEAEEEFEREMKWGGKNKKGKKTNNKDKGLGSRLEAEDEWASLFGGGITGKLPRYANRVTLKNISPNMKLWGVIAEVNTKDLVVSLPGGLRGFVRAEEALDISPDDKHKDLENNFLSCIFHIGQLVPCIVLQVDEDKREGKPNKRIWLSLRLSSLQKGLSLDVLQVGMVLTAQVKSIEDHGYILHFGLSSVSGFLPESSQDDAKMLKTGQLLQGAVKSIDKARRVVILNSDPELVTKCVVQELKGLSIDLLIPGMMVTAQVHATLENGIMLSFLTYLTGTVDIFHLQDSLLNASWKDEYTRKKVNARILFVDPSTRAVGLTLNPYLVRNIAPPRYAKTGDIYEGAKIVRVDKGIGLLLEIPSTPESSPVYVNMFDIDDEIQKLEKKFKEGMHVRVRILGMRHLEGLAMGTLKASALEGSMFTHSDVKPGMLVKAKVIAVESFGAIVQFSSGVKALCPLPHMSEFEIVKPSKKFKIGAELLFRVLGCKSKRITVTHKKTLVKSKLQVLASYTDATEGLITHGWITKIEDHGCFVRFYNGVQGFAHRSELGLEPGSAANTVYHVGQVVKCRIISSSLVSRRINISFVLSRKRDAHDSMIKPGSIVSAVVERLTPGAVIVHVKPDGYMKGTIYNEHLADHQGHASLMKSLLRPGYEFVELLVLDADGDNLILSAKYSLINSSHELPLDISHIRDSSVVHGYICNVIGGGCFVRFLGKLTGFCPQNKVSDNHVDNLSDAYYIGQSVRGYIVAVNSEADRITLSLKQSSCFSTNSSFIQSYFLTESRIAELQIKDTLNSSLAWQEDFSIGSFVEGEVQEMKDYGVVVGFKGHKDVIGFASQYQLGGRSVEIGSHVKTLVLDVSLMDGLVDLSLKEEFVSKADEQGARNLKSKKKRRRESYMGLQLHQTVNAIVEIVKENYLAMIFLFPFDFFYFLTIFLVYERDTCHYNILFLCEMQVLSVPDYNYAIGYASVIDYNTQKIRHTHFINGQSVVATVAALPNPSTVGRLLLLLKSMSDVSELSSRRAKKRSSYAVGSLVDAEITEIKPLEVRMKFGVGCHGRVHITEVFDDYVSVEEPFSSLRIGQVIKVRVIAKAAHSGKTGKGCQWELSLEPSKVSGLGEACDPRTADKPKFSVGDSVRGYVVKVDKEWLWLTVSRDIMAKIFILDTSCEPNELQEFEKHYQVGQAVSGYVSSINEEKKLMRLLPIQSLVTFATLHTSNAYVENQENTLSNIKVTEHLHEGDIVGGRIKTVLPGVGGLLVQIGPHLYGRVHYTELTDQWLTDPLFGYEEGQFVKCKVLEISRSLLSVHVDLSLRASITSFGPSIPEAHHNMDSLYKRLADVEELQPRMVVKGYVKSVTSKGCFIMLSRKIDARILISNLSDGFIEDPEAEFQVGKLVEGRVLSVDTSFKKVDLTLRSEDGTRTLKPSLADLQQLHVGDIISGKIKQIESYGLFITIDHSNIVGLCHKSELAGDHVENFETKYTIGDRVSAKILKVDVERQRISLSMKDIHGEDGSDVPTVSDEEVVGSQTSIDDSLLIVQRKEGATSIDEAYVKMSSGNYPNLAQAESRASVPPLEVVLDDTADSDVDDGPTVSKEVITEQSVVSKKNNRQLKRKELEDRELEISASEERRLQNDIPRTEDEFEKLVRSSPNSSFVWIKYMAFMLSLADVEKARSITERALKTINFREEDEKLNIWVAYFNLENEYGSPPEEAVKKTFERALQYCDPKRLHLALLGMYERTEQYKLADELLEKMVKKFKHSCKIWLRHLQSFLKQRKDGVQTVINRALLCLPRKKHIKFISQAALQEFKCGEPDRGRSMLEGVLREYPKRTDLWSVYLDQEIRLGDAEVTRALFERATCLSLPPKKMKSLFKKYLEYEKSLGDQDKVEYVKRKALEYVESSQT